MEVICMAGRARTHAVHRFVQLPPAISPGCSNYYSRLSNYCNPTAIRGFSFVRCKTPGVINKPIGWRQRLATYRARVSRGGEPRDRSLNSILYRMHTAPLVLLLLLLLLTLLSTTSSLYVGPAEHRVRNPPWRTSRPPAGNSARSTRTGSSSCALMAQVTNSMVMIATRTS